MAILREWLDNPFYEGDTKEKIKAILKITNEETGEITHQEVTVAKGEGDFENPDYKEILNLYGSDHIQENTEKREKEYIINEEKRIKREEEINKAKALEALFEAKLKAFEIEEVKNSINRSLKTKLRRAKNTIEVNIYAMMIVMERLENEKGE